LKAPQGGKKWEIWGKVCGEKEKTPTLETLGGQTPQGKPSGKPTRVGLEKGPFGPQNWETPLDIGNNWENLFGPNWALGRLVERVVGGPWSPQIWLLGKFGNMVEIRKKFGGGKKNTKYGVNIGNPTPKKPWLLLEREKREN